MGREKERGIPLRNPRFLEASMGQKEKSECPVVRPSGYDTTKTRTTHVFEPNARGARSCPIDHLIRL